MKKTFRTIYISFLTGYFLSFLSTLDTINVEPLAMDQGRNVYPHTLRSTDLSDFHVRSWGTGLRYPFPITPLVIQPYYSSSVLSWARKISVLQRLIYNVLVSPIALLLLFPASVVVSVDPLRNG